MDFSDFRSRAVAEGKRYGKDEYVFVREFAQNARDAGASRISIDAVYHQGNLVTTFTDNGVGMSFDHARKFLFTLYASSKEGQQSTAGQFGVGFWSILLFSPTQIVISSNSVKENWGVEFDHDLDGERRVSSTLNAPGTQVIALKPMNATQGAAAVRDIENAIVRYCRYLRRNNRKASPMKVLFNAKRIDGPMVLEGDCCATFEYSDVQGAVALGKIPKVNLYVRGLPVWMGTSLTELQYGASPEVQISYPRGLAPVYLINGNKLNVTLDRRSVFDDAALQRTRRIAQREMRKLVASYLDNVAPRTFRSRVEFAVISFFEDFVLHFSRRMAPLLPVLIAIIATVGLSWFVFPKQASEVLNTIVPGIMLPSSDVPEQFGTILSSSRYEQASTHTGTGSALDLSYRPKDESHYFRMQVVEQLHLHTGARSGELLPYRIPANYSCKKDCVQVTVALERDVGVYNLPVPSGFYVDVKTLHRSEVTGTNASSPLHGELVRSVKDDWLFVQKQTVKETDTTLSYTAGPVTTAINDNNLFLKAPKIILPTAYEEALKKVAPFKRRKKKVDQLTLFVEASIAYDVSSQTAARYQRFFDTSSLDKNSQDNWFDFVFQTNKGDCDVKNIVLLAMLRRLHIPSRLAVGYVGEDGKTKSGQHAWIEYYDKGWKIADATGQASEMPVDQEPSEASDSISATSTVGTSVDTDSSSLPNPSPVASTPEPISQSTLPAQSPVSESLFDKWNLAIGGAGLFLIGCIVALLLLWRRKCADAPTPSVRQEELVAHMLQAALEDEKLHPRGSGLFSRSLIPTWKQGCRISMKQAWALAKKKKLFYSDQNSPMVSQLVASKKVVIDTSRSAFVPVVTRIAGSFSLNEVDSLRPVLITAENQTTSPAYQVLRRAICLADELGLAKNFIVPCRGVNGVLFKEMDIAILPGKWKHQIPKQFAAVSLQEERTWQQLVQLGNGVEGAAILLLDRLAAHCVCLQSKRRSIRSALAKRKLSEPTSEPMGEEK